MYVKMLVNGLSELYDFHERVDFLFLSYVTDSLKNNKSFIEDFSE